MRRTWILLTLVALASPASHADEKPRMLFLGTTHLANHNKDVANTHVENVLVPKRQAEIEALVDQLAAFRPTHIALELPYASQGDLDARYAAYRAGTYTLKADETDQIGMRLAKKLGLARVDAVDWNGSPPGDEASYDAKAWAQAHGKADLYQAYVDRWKAFAARDTAYLPGHTVTQWYLRFNDPARMREDGANYFDMARFGDDTDNPGAAWVGHWYARNLRIFTHIRDLATKPTDRILVIYGAGHGPFLRKDAVDSGVFELVEPQQYLKAPYP
ncbi:DUF5694 domain-containing protein [Luteibacter yeojuensis]|uniref:Uncharacterized protein n=1 Tax=Luteibacter yeojuensis TaxID=345309 RepID=A0A0F3KMG1_9GAMM|nr:DUF5694 domain-containing protein [Luteibacter yeojuensis]KJV32455.1 hypothetical protein VI08_11910 [Luteibacter yeojuensis]